MYNSFTELEVWKVSKKFRMNINQLCKTFPKEEKYLLKDQLIRASRSICANIAEGHGRFHYQENIQYCRIARGSAYECLDHLICAKENNYILEGELKTLSTDLTRIFKLLNGYINFLKKQKARK